MLNLPLSLLSNEILECVVELVGQDLDPKRDVREEGNWRRQLQSFSYAVTTNPCALQWVRAVALVVCSRIEDRSGVFQETTFRSILNRLASADYPPEYLRINSFSNKDIVFHEADVALEILSTSIGPNFVRMNLAFCRGVPLQLLLILPRLKELSLDHVAPQVGKPSRGPALQKGATPSLETFSFRRSHDMVEQLLNPFEELDQGTIDLSALRVLVLPPSDINTFPFVPKLLERAQKALEVLDISMVGSHLDDNIHPSYIPITSYLDLRILQELRSFRLVAAMTYNDPPGDHVVADVADALHAVPQSNNLDHISINFHITGSNPFHQARGQDWGRLAEEIARVATGKRFGVEIYLGVGGEDPFDCDSDEGRRELCELIKSQLELVWKDETDINVTFKFNIQ
ncbi:hypothetical protein BKA70DRAFT_1464400 [Coprinopsis sp. MPI-PUGE-AT-0042]|nr:hypothetical protein BKA70DRAFT_1464400 [Coprinopsis sp. MPI-PUGE-AT-0042]